MARVSTNHFSTVQKQWMVVGRKTSEACFNREPANSPGDEINLRPVGEFVALFVCAQAFRQTDEAGKEKDETSSCSRRQGPTSDHPVPKNRQGNKVGPY